MKRDTPAQRHALNIVAASLREAKGHAVREMIRSEDTEGAERKADFLDACQRRAEELIRNPRQ